jgi:hypothetical protein
MVIHRGLFGIGKIYIEAIPNYWMLLAWIQKGILELIRILCYRIVWSGDQVKKGISLISWKNIAIPKAQGGWGLKNIFIFSKDLSTKNVFQLIQVERLWEEVIRDKYLLACL